MKNEFLLDDFMKLLGRSKDDIRSLEEGYGVLSLYSNDDLNKIASDLGASSGSDLRIKLEESIADLMNQQYAQSKTKSLDEEKKDEEDEETKDLKDLTNQIKNLTELPKEDDLKKE